METLIMKQLIKISLAGLLGLAALTVNTASASHINNAALSVEKAVKVIFERQALSVKNGLDNAAGGGEEPPK